MRRPFSSTGNLMHTIFFLSLELMRLEMFPANPVPKFPHITNDSFNFHLYFIFLCLRIRRKKEVNQTKSKPKSELGPRPVPGPAK